MKKDSVLTYAGGGGASLNRLHNGRDFAVLNNHRCGSRDYIA